VISPITAAKNVVLATIGPGPDLLSVPVLKSFQEIIAVKGIPSANVVCRAFLDVLADISRRVTGVSLDRY
jgi:hypothetical protein